MLKNWMSSYIPECEVFKQWIEINQSRGVAPSKKSAPLISTAEVLHGNRDFAASAGFYAAATVHYFDGRPEMKELYENFPSVDEVRRMRQE